MRLSIISVMQMFMSRDVNNLYFYMCDLNTQIYIHPFGYTRQKSQGRGGGWALARVSPLPLIETRGGGVKMSLRLLIYSSTTSSSSCPTSSLVSPFPRLNIPVTDNYGCAHSTSFHLSISVQSLSSWVFQCAPGYSTLLLLCRCPVSYWQPLLITISFLRPAHTFFLSLQSHCCVPLLLQSHSHNAPHAPCGERGTCVAEPPLSADRLPPMQLFFFLRPII